ncbi:hypothetical protein M0R45_034848 [Rubus argutus]|uniref:Uncharacterized protein n=1 Tax=Rubus argutus TaxID=59490 RepID=A0AAW1VRD4_RUBAR
MENLVVLEMQYSSLRQLWKGTKCLPSLKIIDVSHSHDLTKTDTLGLFFGGKASGKDIPSKLIEIEYWFKLEPIGKVDAEMINLLSLSNLESLTPVRLGTICATISGTPRLHPGSEGLNIFSVYALTTSASRIKGTILDGPVLTAIYNKSKGLRWIYFPSCWGIPSKGEDVTWLSHWNFGNQLEAGDQVSVFVIACRHGIQVREWGFQVVHEPVEKMFSQHNKVLNVIGGDLSELYLLIPGTYLLFGGPIESCRMSHKLYKQAWFNFSGLIADLNADAVAEVDWQRLLFGEVLEELGPNWLEMFGKALVADAEVDCQRMYREEFGLDWQMVYWEAFVKNFSGLIENSDIDTETGALLIYI